ncbi:DEKNAAC105404 [Brettanomyces naardenensis]|uniref:Large ribosomal subunit protein mL54 n=1 Tax=Brettanomyces naardenensis TaxID=13370 RepID=A0A448YT91_BRENA|nr:DEKNAAC105404 [Brettanomyces naardenensis]
MNRAVIRLFSSSTRALQSSCKEGTPITLEIYKAGKPVVAKKDEEYPPWLWTLLDKEKQMEDLKKSDYFKYKRRQVKKRNVEQCKMNNFMAKMK